MLLVSLIIWINNRKILCVGQFNIWRIKEVKLSEIAFNLIPFKKNNTASSKGLHTDLYLKLHQILQQFISYPVPIFHYGLPPRASQRYARKVLDFKGFLRKSFSLSGPIKDSRFFSKRRKPGINCLSFTYALDNRILTRRRPPKNSHARCGTIKKKCQYLWGETSSDNYTTVRNGQLTFYEGVVEEGRY